MDHKLHRLGDGHEIAGCLRVDGERPAQCDLLAEDGDNTAPAAQDIAKPNDDEAGRRVALGSTLHQQLGHAFSSSHNRGRVHRFVRGDQYETAHGCLSRSLDKVSSAKDIVGHCLINILLHEGNVLICRGMKHDLRPVPIKDPLNLRRVPNVSDYGAKRQIGEGPAQLPLNLENAMFAMA